MIFMGFFGRISFFYESGDFSVFKKETQAEFWIGCIMKLIKSGFDKFKDFKWFIMQSFFSDFFLVSDQELADFS